MYVHKIFNWAEGNPEPEEMNNKLLLSTDSAGKAAWHLAAEKGNLDTLRNVWDYAEEKLKIQERSN